MSPKISPPAAAATSDDHHSPTTTTTTTTTTTNSSSSEPHQSPQSKHPHPPTHPHLSDSESDSDADSGETKSTTVADMRKTTDSSHMGPSKKSSNKGGDKVVGGSTKPHFSDTDSDSDADSEDDSDDGPKPISVADSGKRKNVDFSDKGPMKKKPHVPGSEPESHPHFKPIITALPAITNKGENTMEKVEKVEKDGASSSMGRPMFQRIWSEDDEIVILRGLVEFREKYGKDPMSNVDEFLDFIKSSLHVVDVKREQFVRKIRRLKTRFQNRKRRSLTNAHEVNVFNLSKIVWGGGSSSGMSLKGCGSQSNNSKSKASILDNGGKDENGNVGNVSKNNGIRVGDMNKFGDVDGKFMEEALKLIGEVERGELEKEWRNLNVAGMEGLVKRIELYRKTAKSLLNVAKSSSSKC